MNSDVNASASTSTCAGRTPQAYLKKNFCDEQRHVVSDIGKAVGGK